MLGAACCHPDNMSWIVANLLVAVYCLWVFDLAIGRPPAHVDNLGIEASRSYTGLQLDAKERDRLMTERENERDALATERHQQLMGQSEKQGQCLTMLIDWPIDYQSRASYIGWLADWLSFSY
jgi:hypothetical protein